MKKQDKKILERLMREETLGIKKNKNWKLKLIFSYYDAMQIVDEFERRRNDNKRG